MTPEEAKRLIDNQIIMSGRRNGKTLFTDFICTVRSALDKQIPKPIAHVVKKPSIFCMFPTLAPVCPTCGYGFEKHIEGPKRCPECGQALKWK